MPPKQRSTGDPGAPAASGPSGAHPGVTRPAAGGLRRGLDLLDRGRLVELLVQAASRHPDLARQLALESAQASDDLLGIAHTLDSTLRVTQRLSHAATLRYADAAADVLRTLTGLVSTGRAGAALPLLSHAIDLVGAAMRHTASRSGALRQLMDDLLHMHAVAAASVDPRPDPVALAGWLASLQLDGPDGITVPVADYAPVLGSAGLAAYRGQVAERWEADRENPRARAAREALARFDRDIPALVDVLGGDLRRAVQYSRLARALRDIGARAEAIAWAERGLREHPEERSGSGLREFLVSEYAGTDDPAGDVALRRAALEGAPTLTAYVALRTAARTAGSWGTDRPHALAVLRDRRPDEYIRALLADDDVVTGWAQATRLPLRPEVWDELARRHAATSPADAVPVLRRRIDEVLAVPSRANYRDAVHRLIELRAACRRSGQPAVFEEYLRQITLDHSNRPAFLRELAEAGLTA